MRDTARIYRKLLTLPRNYDIIMLKPSRIDQLIGKQFKKELIVRSPIIIQQLYQLKENYISYLNIIIDKEALTQLSNNPKGQVVIDDVTIYNYNLAATEDGNRVTIRGDR